jgi:hypothetical protein
MPAPWSTCLDFAALAAATPCPQRHLRTTRHCTAHWLAAPLTACFRPAPSRPLPFGPFVGSVSLSSDLSSSVSPPAASPATSACASPLCTCAADHRPMPPAPTWRPFPSSRQQPPGLARIGGQCSVSVAGADVRISALQKSLNYPIDYWLFSVSRLPLQAAYDRLQLLNHPSHPFGVWVHDTLPPVPTARNRLPQYILQSCASQKPFSHSAAPSNFCINEAMNALDVQELSQQQASFSDSRQIVIPVFF